MKYIKEKYNLKNVMFLRIEDMPNTTITPCVYLIDKDLKITHFLSIATNDIILPSYAYSGGYPFSISGDIRSVPS